jgi:hypothetical protein
MSKITQFKYLLINEDIYTQYTPCYAGEHLDILRFLMAAFEKLQLDRFDKS